jgi:large repetitive protein
MRRLALMGLHLRAGYRLSAPRSWPRVLTAAALLSSAMVVTAAGSAPAALAAPARYSAPQASGTVLFNQPFHDNTVDGSAGSVSVPTSTASGAANSACLTASGNSTANPLASCPSPSDAQGSGTLRLTPDTGGKVGGIFASTSVPTSQGLDATFNTFQYGTATPAGADGIAFVLGATNPASPSTPTAIGPTGGALGYSSTSATSPAQSGLPYGYMGIGLDAYGNFSNKQYEGSGCTNPSNISTLMPGQVVIRGPGNGTVGYCPVQSSATTSTSPSLTLTASTRSASQIPVEVVINPTSSTLTTASGLSVPAGDYDVTFTPVGGTATSLVGTLPTVPSGLYPSSWVNSAGIPKQLLFGWVASTGAVLDYHELNNAVVTSLAPVPKLAISLTSYAASSLSKGSPVTYVATASSSGPTESQPVTITLTAPSGVLPLSAYGTGWTCAAPSGQQISCTSTGSTFTSGTITVNGISTSSSLTSASVASGSTATASSSDGSPATATATAGTVPSAPTVTSISPTNGAAGGGNAATITGTGLSTATAIEIGTTAEFTGGTPTTLVLCSAPAAGCFTITNSTTIAISSMPAHAAGSVTVAVVSQGTEGTVSYTYNTGPALIFGSPPGGEVGVSYSDPLTVTGGTSPFTWSISSGSLPPGITIGASTGLLSGTPTTAGTYSFTVKVTDIAGLSATEATSITIVPGPSLTFSAPPQGWTNTVYSDTLTATGGTTPYTFSISSGSLPPGISLSASGVLSGTPTSTGTYSFTVKLTDAAGQTTTKATTLTVATGVTTNFAAPPSGSVGIAYSYTLTATGGTTPYTWSVNAGTLPPGITLSSAGVLSGTPTTTGSYPFTVNVVDANGGVSTASITLVITAAPVLTINSTASVSTTTPGSVVTYTITATNAGAVAYTGATFTDSLSGLLDDATYNSNATATSGSVSYSSPNLTWTGNLAVGAVATITFSVTVNNPDTGSKVLSSTVTSTTTGSNCASGSTDSRCSVSVTVLVPGLTMSVSAASGTATPGSVVSYTVTVTNSGQTAYTGATLTASLSGALDDATYNGDAAASAGSVSYSSPNLTWTGNLAIGVTATITYSMTVKNPDPGDKVLIVTLTSTTSGSNCASGSSDPLCTTSVSVLVPGLTIVASAGSGTTTPGAVVSYTITVTNSGQTAYTGATFSDSLSGVLDDATYNANAAATAGTVSYSSRSLSWTGNLAVGASATITFSATVNNPDTGDDILASVVTSTTAGSNCASGSTDSRCSVSVPVAVLTIVNGANVATTTPGSVVRFTATFTNAGQVPYTGITLTDDATNVFDDATPNGDQTATSGTLTLTATGISWTGSIPVGGTVTVTGTVTVNNPDTGNKLLAATIVATAPGSNCASGSTDPRCSVSVSVLVPGLSLTQAANASTAVPGQQVTYTVTITNSGQTAYTAISAPDSIAASLDDASYDNDASVTSGSVSYASGVLTWTGNLAAGASAVLTFSLTVNNPDTGDKLLLSTLSSAATGSNCPTTSAPASCTLQIKILTPGLTIAKTASVPTAVPGQVITYTITVTDSGQTPYTGATFTDSLSGVIDDAAYDNDASATAGTVSYASPNLTWTGNLAVGGSATITYTATVNNPDTGDMVLTNTVTSTTPGDNCPSGGTDPRCSVTVSLVNVATLTFTNATNVSAAAQGGVADYTITVANSGLSAYPGATFTLPLSGVLDDASYNGDAAASMGAVSFSSPNLTWTGTVPASGTVTVTFSVTVKNPDTGNMIMASTLTSTSLDSNCASTSTDPRCSSTVTVAELTIVAGANVSFATPGSVVRFTTTFTNNGQTPYTGITITNSGANTFANATPNGDQTATSGTIVVTTAGVVWTGSIPVGGTVTITGTVTVDNPDLGNNLLGGTFITTALGSNCPAGSTDPRCSVSLPVLTPGLTISQAANTSFAVPGQRVTFTVTIADTGQTAYTGAVATASLAGLTDDATYDNDASTNSGTVSYTSPVITWTGNLAVGGSAVLTYSVTVNNPDTGDKQLVSVAASTVTGSTCPPGSSNTGCSFLVPVLTPALTITNSGSPSTAVPGGTVSYTITITNTGQIPYTGTTVTDDLTGVLDDAAYNSDASATAGTVSFASPDLTWTGNLALAGSVTVTFSVTVHNPDTNDHLLESTVTSSAAGSNCAAGSTDPRCSVTIDVAELDITNIANVSTTIPGSVVDYTVTITDAGQTTYPGTTVTDDLTGVFDDATYNNDGATTAGSVTYISPDLTWTGSLAPGADAVITFSVTVNNPDTGDRQLLSTTATTSAIGSNCSSANPVPACTSTVTVLIPVLTITKTASSGTTTPGSVVSYTITIADTGPTPYTGATVTDDLSGVFDDATYNDDAVTNIGTVSYASPVLTWTGNLAVGATATITYSITINNPDMGDKVPVNTATSTAIGSTCPPATTNPDCTATVHVLVPGLTITKTANTSTTTPGSVVDYTITVTDSGQTSYSPATLTDDLSGVLGDSTYNNDATVSDGTASYATPTLTWTANLTPGTTATLTYSVTVNDADLGDHTLANTVASTDPGSTCPTDSTNAACSVTIPIVPGPLSILAPGSAALGSTAPGTALSGTLGTVEVIDDRGFGADWTATVSSTDFTTGNGAGPRTVPAADARYLISALNQDTGPATFSSVPSITLSSSPQAVVSATDVDGNTTATWTPVIDVQVPASAIGGTYTAVITNSVS